MLEYIFKSILITSLLGSFLAILLTAVKPLTKKYFSGNWHYYIWLTVLFVMILPVRFVLPEQSITNQETIIVNETVNVAETEIENVTGEDYYITADTVKQPEVEYNDSSKISVTFLPIIWIAIATLYFVIKVIEYILFVINNHKYSRVVPCPELAKYTDRKISVRVSNKISSPLMLGVFKPVILLPDKALTDEQLNNVLAHETTHYKRGDILYKWFATVVKCIHWFNPIVYYVVKQINIECEISCDLSVVKYMSREQEINYVDTILALLSDRASGPVSLTTGMTGDKKTLQRRFEMIKNKSVISKKTVIISAILAGLLFSCIVFASGIISGKLIKFNENLLAINTDEVNGERTNFLVIGTDEQGRADSVIVLSDNGEMLSLLSIPRNVMYDGKSMSDTMNVSEAETLLNKFRNSDKQRYIRTIDVENSPEGVLNKFFDKFKDSNIEEMKWYCTDEFIDKRFDYDSVFGITKAELINTEPLEYYNEDEIHIKAEILSLGNVWPKSPQTQESTLYIALVRGDKDNWLIDRFCISYEELVR